MSSLPFHPTIPNLQALGCTKRGRPIWPVMGGSEDGGEQGGQQAGGQQEQQGGQQQNGGQDGNTDMGFPANTPVAQMTDSQRAAYYQHQNRQTDNKLKAFHGFTPDDVNSMWTRLQEVETERLSEGERTLREATASAAAQARADAEAELRPKLLASQLRSVASPAFAGDKAKLDAWLDGIDPAKFVGENGDIDETKVTNHLSAFVSPQGPGNPGYQWGQHSGPAPATQPGEAGRAEAERRKKGRVYT